MTVVLLFVGVVVLVLAVPVRVAVTVHGEERPRIRVRLRALFGLVDRELRAPRRDGRIERRRGDGGRYRAATLLRDERFRARSRRLIVRLVHAVQIRELRGAVRIGLDDPADTGELCALLGPASAIVANHHPDFELTPSFAGAELAVDVYCAVVLVPLRVAAAVIGFVLHRSVLAAVIAARRSS